MPAGVEDQKHYEAYESAIRDGLALIMRYLKMGFFGPPRSGKSTTLKRLIKEIENLNSVKGPSITCSTGVAETTDVIIKKLTSETAALPHWKLLKRSKEDGKMEAGDVCDLAKLFYHLITKRKSESKQSADKDAPVVDMMGISKKKQWNYSYFRYSYILILYHNISYMLLLF